MDQNELTKHFQTLPVSHNSRYNIDVEGDNLAAKCAKCGFITLFGPCSNCNGRIWVGGTNNDGEIGLFCTNCDLGHTRWNCKECGASNSIRASFGQVQIFSGLSPLAIIVIVVIAIVVIASLLSQC